MSIEMRAALLRQAERLIRTRGYSAFSYNDLAVGNSIRKASIHHYFPRKEDLAVEVVTGRMAEFRETLADIERSHAHLRERLRAYGQLFLDDFDDGMLPICGALSAERAALPESLRDHVDAFFRMQLEWLTKIMREAVKAQEIASDRDPDRLAMLVFSTVEGGSLIAWAMDERGPVLSGFEDVVESVMDRPARRRSAADKARVSAPAKGRGR